MVEQIDRTDADRQAAIDLVAIAQKAERARMIARMREPDAAMVKRVGNDIDTAWHVCESLPPIEFRNHERALLATAALSAAADAMEVGDAG